MFSCGYLSRPSPINHLNHLGFLEEDGLCACYPTRNHTMQACRARLMGHWATCSRGRWSCLWQGVWNLVILKVPSNPEHFMLPNCCCNCTHTPARSVTLEQWRGPPCTTKNPISLHCTRQTGTACLRWKGLHLLPPGRPARNLDYLIYLIKLIHSLLWLVLEP